MSSKKENEILKNISTDLMNCVDKLTIENIELKKKVIELEDYINDMEAACLAVNIKLPVIKYREKS